MLVLATGAILNSCAVVEDSGSDPSPEFPYGASLGFENIGPDNGFMPAHIYRCDPSGVWAIAPGGSS